MNLTQIRSNVSAILGLDNSVSGDQPLIDFYANEAVRKILVATRCYVTSTTYTPGAVDDYTLPAATLEIVDAYFSNGDSRYRLERRSIDEIIELRRGGTAAAGPARYYALAGQSTLMFWPAPAAGDVLNLYHVPYPTELSTGTHDPSNATYGGIPAENHDLIEFYDLWRMADYDDDGSSAQGSRYRDLYKEGVVELKRHLRSRGGGRLAPARVRRGRLIRSHDPSADW